VGIEILTSQMETKASAVPGADSRFQRSRRCVTIASGAPLRSVRRSDFRERDSSSRKGANSGQAWSEGVSGQLEHPGVMGEEEHLGGVAELGEGM